MGRKLSVWLAFGFLGIISQSAIHLASARATQTGVRAQDGETGSLKIVIWAYNYAHVPDRTLAETKKEVTRILARAGISAEWIQCPVSAAEVQAHPACQDRMSARELALTLLPQFKASTRGNSDTYFGSAQVFSNGQFGHYAYVFYDRVEDAENCGGASPHQILAAIALHEIGHLLLRSSAHSRTGLMSGQWDQRDLENAAQGQLCFTPQQAQVIRAEVSMRNRMQQAAAIPGITAESGLKVIAFVYNYARVEPATLALAENEALRIFQHAGLTVVWRDIPLSLLETRSVASFPPNEPAGGFPNVFLRIVPSSMSPLDRDETLAGC